MSENKKTTKEKEPILTWNDEDWRKRPPWYYKLDSILLTILIIVTIIAFIHGQFIAKETHIIETCEGQIISFDKIPSNQLNETFKNNLQISINKMKEEAEEEERK